MPPDAENYISFAKAQRGLALVWYGISLPAFGTLMVQTMSDVFGARVPEVWGWALPTMLPTLSLITGVVIVEAVQAGKPSHKDRKVPVFAYRATATLSLFYLLAVLGVVYSSAHNGYSVSALQRSNMGAALLRRDESTATSLT